MSFDFVGNYGAGIIAGHVVTSPNFIYKAGIVKKHAYGKNNNKR